MRLSVIGAGFGRTGTRSLKLALDRLGFGPCYHMSEAFQHPEHALLWMSLATGASHDFDAVLGSYGSAVDWPVVSFYRALADANPSAKVVLTERNPESWYDSMRATIFERMTFDVARAEYPDQLRMAKFVVGEKTFANRFDKDHAIAVYERHNAEVRRVIAPGRLLVLSGEMGWAPLCEFLGVPVPDEPYPKANTAAEFRGRARVGGAYHR
jgi:hypothetical protein